MAENKQNSLPIISVNQKHTGWWARRYEGRKSLCKLPWISLNLLSFLGTCVLLYRSKLWGKRPLNTVLEALVFKNSLRLVLTMSLWSVGRLGRENKVSDTKPVHSLGEFLRNMLAKKHSVLDVEDGWVLSLIFTFIRVSQHSLIKKN